MSKKKTAKKILLKEFLDIIKKQNPTLDLVVIKKLVNHSLFREKRLFKDFREVINNSQYLTSDKRFVVRLKLHSYLRFLEKDVYFLK